MMLHPRGLLRSMSWIQPSRSFRFGTGSRSAFDLDGYTDILALVCHANSENIPRVSLVRPTTLGLARGNQRQSRQSDITETMTMDMQGKVLLRSGGFAPDLNRLTEGRLLLLPKEGPHVHKPDPIP